MAEFSRIQVTPAEEGDIGILAGAVEEPVSSDTADGPYADEAAFEEAPIAEEASIAPARTRDAYTETTLADLQRTRMSGMQKAIIALAIVAVVAFIIWYVLLR